LCAVDDSFLHVPVNNHVGSRCAKCSSEGYCTLCLEHYASHRRSFMCRRCHNYFEPEICRAFSSHQDLPPSSGRTSPFRLLAVLELKPERDLRIHVTSSGQRCVRVLRFAPGKLDHFFLCCMIPFSECHVVSNPERLACDFLLVLSSLSHVAPIVFTYYFSVLYFCYLLLFYLYRPYLSSLLARLCTMLSGCIDSFWC